MTTHLVHLLGVTSIAFKAYKWQRWFVTCFYSWTYTILCASLSNVFFWRRCLSYSHLKPLLSTNVWITQGVFVPHRSLTRNITQPGTASLGETLAVTWLMRPSISFTSTWVRWPFCCSSPAEGTHFLDISWPYIQYWLTQQRHYHSLARGHCLFLCCSLFCFWGFKKKKKKTMWPCLRDETLVFIFVLLL